MMVDWESKTIPNTFAPLEECVDIFMAKMLDKKRQAEENEVLRKLALWRNGMKDEPPFGSLAAKYPTEYGDIPILWMRLPEPVLSFTNHQGPPCLILDGIAVGGEPYEPIIKFGL